MFRPCMHRKMGLCNNHHPAHPLGVKLMERGTDNGGTAIIGTLKQRFFNGIFTDQDILPAIIVFNGKLPAQGEYRLLGIG